MALKDDVKKMLNTFFERQGEPIKFNWILLYRPVFREPPFEHIEVINSADRLSACDPIYILFQIKYIDHRYDYETRCRNEDGKFRITFCQLKACDVFAEEDAKELERKMSETIRFINYQIVSLLEFLSTKK